MPLIWSRASTGRYACGTVHARVPGPLATLVGVTHWSDTRSTPLAAMPARYALAAATLRSDAARCSAVSGASSAGAFGPAAATGAIVSADIRAPHNAAIAIRLVNMGAASCSTEAGRRSFERSIGHGHDAGSLFTADYRLLTGRRARRMRTPARFRAGVLPSRQVGVPLLQPRYRWITGTRPDGSSIVSAWCSWPPCRRKCRMSRRSRATRDRRCGDRIGLSPPARDLARP